jgi:hypothetical protein
MRVFYRTLKWWSPCRGRMTCEEGGVRVDHREMPTDADARWFHALADNCGFRPVVNAGIAPM